MLTRDRRDGLIDEVPELNAPTYDDVQTEIAILYHGDGAMHRFEVDDSDRSTDY